MDGVEVLLASNRWRPGMPLNTLQPAGRPHHQAQRRQGVCPVPGTQRLAGEDNAGDEATGVGWAGQGRTEAWRQEGFEVGTDLCLRTLTLALQGQTSQRRVGGSRAAGWGQQTRAQVRFVGRGGGKGVEGTEKPLL